MYLNLLLIKQTLDMRSTGNDCICDFQVQIAVKAWSSCVYTVTLGSRMKNSAYALCVAIM